VGVVIAGTVVGVDGFLTVIVGNDEVVVDVVPLFEYGGTTVKDLGDVHLTVPTVEGAVISGFTARVQDNAFS